MASIEKIIVLMFLAIILIPIVIHSQINLSNKILFDDFKYNSVEYPIEGDSSGSIFGSNPWITENGIIYTPAWRRYNRDNHNFGKNSSIELNDDGFSLKIQKGFKTKDVMPIVTSAFYSNGGTYAAKVKFHTMSNDSKFIQAFWLTSPLYFIFKLDSESIIYWSEMDFEYNNFFIGNNDQTMSVGCNNHVGKPPIAKPIECICKDQSGKYGYEKCLGLYKGNHILVDKWFYLMMNLDSADKTLSFSMLCDSSDFVDLKIWAGDTYDTSGWGIAYKINNYFPEYSLLTLFSIHIGTENESAISNNQMDVDWYYYSENSKLSFEELKNDISSLRKNQIARINTTNLLLFPEAVSDEPGIISIEGLDSISQCESNSWKLKSNYKRHAFFDITFKYRFFDKNGPEEWVEIFKPHVTLIPGKNHTQLELVSTAFDYWGSYLTMDTMIVKIGNSYCPKDTISFIVSKPYPNPTFNKTRIDYELVDKSNVSIKVYDLLGRVIDALEVESLDKGNYSYYFDGFNQPIGIYLVIFNINNNLFFQKILLCKQ